MSIRRAMRRAAQREAATSQRATMVVLEARGGELEVSIVGPKRPGRSPREREDDLALRKLAEAARDWIGEVIRDDAGEEAGA